ncbi:MAG: AtpZ/AtpI family protein [Firmicutes bacterium]|nr:AtpZ/AtpI family protein [Bacillota bacterium]
MATKKNDDNSNEYHSSGVYTYLRICSTFGLTLALSIYVFSVLLGGWLDERFGTDPLFRVLLLLMSLVAAGYYLFKSVESHEKVEKELKKQFEEEHSEHQSLEDRVAALKKDLKR